MATEEGSIAAAACTARERGGKQGRTSRAELGGGEHLDANYIDAVSYADGSVMRERKGRERCGGRKTE